MSKIILSKQQIHEIITNNRYQVDKRRRLFSRCIEGHYPPLSDLPALTFPGADAGQLAHIFATGNQYGLKVDKEKVYKTLADLINGEKNLQFHSDSHADKDQALAGCGHIKQIIINPRSYNIEKEQINFIRNKFASVMKNGVKQTILQGEHNEGAILLIKGNWGIYPQFFLTTGEGNIALQVFIYHQTLVDQRHRILAKKLIENKAVELYYGCNEDYLYQILSETAENHLMETVKRLAVGLPIYFVSFSNDGSLIIEEMGRV